MIKLLRTAEEGTQVIIEIKSPGVSVRLPKFGKHSDKQFTIPNNLIESVSEVEGGCVILLFTGTKYFTSANLDTVEQFRNLYETAAIPMEEACTQQ